jgi:hypothetical protein
MRRALLASREAGAAWQESDERARQEPVHPRGLTSREAEEAQEALKGFGRAAMLGEGQSPRTDRRLDPESKRFAAALEADTAQAAANVREHRNPDWRRVKEALHAWDGAAGDRSPVVRGGGGTSEAGPGRPCDGREPHTPGTGRQLCSGGSAGAGGRGGGR